MAIAKVGPYVSSTNFPASPIALLKILRMCYLPDFILKLVNLGVTVCHDQHCTYKAPSQGTMLGQQALKLQDSQSQGTSNTCSKDEFRRLVHCFILQIALLFSLFPHAMLVPDNMSHTTKVVVEQGPGDYSFCRVHKRRI